MNAEIISVGTEILLGNIANTDAQMISEGLSELGINVYYHTVTGDNPERLRKAVEAARERADIIITTGGLGPTYDDLTKETLAECFGRKLVLDEGSLELIKEAFRGFRRPMTENNVKQAMLPEGCVILKNDWGTAPGCAFCEGGTHVIMLPGPPRECRPMFFERAKPYLAGLSEGIIKSHNIRIYGIGESAMEAKVKDEIENLTNPTVAPYAKEGECLLRVTAKAASEEDAEKLLAPEVEHLMQIFGDAVYGIDANSLEEVTVKLLMEKKLTLATAESCTGGLLSKRITDIPGASDVFAGGICAYSNAVKEKMADVPHDILEKYGAVSEETARALAEGIRNRLGADIGVGITGIAGPGGGTDEKPVGTVHIAVASPAGTAHEVIYQTGDRERVRNAAVLRALNMTRLAALSL